MAYHKGWFVLVCASVLLVTCVALAVRTSWVSAASNTAPVVSQTAPGEAATQSAARDNAADVIVVFLLPLGLAISAMALLGLRACGRAGMRPIMRPYRPL
jgi:hypothetical protein